MNKTILPFLSLIVLSNLTVLAYGQQTYDLKFKAKNYTTQTLTHEGKTFKVRVRGYIPALPTSTKENPMGGRLPANPIAPPPVKVSKQLKAPPAFDGLDNASFENS